MIGIQRPLTGLVVNISVSESDESAALGFPPWQVNRTTLQVVSALFGQGATILFGHDWREDGVMEAVYGFARQVQSPILLSSAEERSSDGAILLNLLPWPDKPYLPEKNLEGLSSTLRVVPAGLPDGLRTFDEAARSAGRGSPLYRYMRARGLTHLRHQLSRDSDARLCMGGRRTGSAGRYPGVVEEALFALRSSKPLYVAGLLGGASKQIIEALEGHKMPEDFCAATEVLELYRNPPVRDVNHSAVDDETVDRRQVWEEFAKAGIGRIAEAANLTRLEVDELLHTRAIDRVIELVLEGLSRLRTDAS
jgi:hypothetical protein